MSATPSTRAIRYVVTGRVQGVFFRAATMERALALGLHGCVRNLPDGCVEVIAAGSEAAQSGLAAWLWEGPPAARVDSVRIEEWQQPVADGFVVAR